MKRLLSVMMTAVLLLSLSGCGSIFRDAYDMDGHLSPERVNLGKEFDVNLKVVAPYGAPTLSMVKMFVEHPPVGEGVKVDYEAIQATDVLMTTIVNGEADIAVVPTNMAAALFNKDVDYKLAGSSVWGIMYLVTTEDVDSMEALSGGNIGTVGKNATPDALLRFVLTENGIDPETDVTIDYFSGSSEMAAAFIAGETTSAMIPEPMLTTVMNKVENAKVLVDMQSAWSDITGMESYPQASVIVKGSVAEAYPEVVAAFLEEYNASVSWTNEEPGYAAQYYEMLNLGLNRDVIEKAIPGCNLAYVPATQAQESIDHYLGVLYDFNPGLLGGQPVNEAMYLK